MEKINKVKESVKQYAQKKMAERRSGTSVPQETEESKDPKPVFVIDDEIGEESNQKPIIKSKMLAEEPAHEPIYVGEKNKSKIAKAQSSGDAYEAFELAIPLRLIDFRDFEGRIKKLVFNKSCITIRQL